MAKESRQRYSITLTPTGNYADPDHPVRRLRALLKAALRVYGFRCVVVEPVQESIADTEAVDLAPPPNSQGNTPDVL